MSRIAEGMAPGPYGRLPGYKERGTSRDAARAVSAGSRATREAIFAAIAGAGAEGLTADEASERAGVSTACGRPRVTELSAMGRIIRTGKRRPNATGLSAAAWMVAP